MIPLNYYIMLSAVLFCIGVYGILTRKSAILVLMSIEIVLNSANINFVAFSAYGGWGRPQTQGQVFALISIALAAAEAAVGLAIYFVLYRTHRTINVEEVNVLKW
jgi:NADH-quinone oxidoreductase subunit K